MLFISRSIKDDFYSRQFLRQYTLELTFSAFAFAHQHAWMPKIIKYKVIWSQMQIFVAADANYDSKIVQSRRSFASGIFAFIYCFHAARPSVFCYDSYGFLNIRQRYTTNSADTSQVCMNRRWRPALHDEEICVILNVRTAFAQRTTAVLLLTPTRKLDCMIAVLLLSLGKHRNIRFF